MSESELSPVAIRVKEFIDYLQISNSQFADQSGIPRPTLSQLLHGRNKTINDLLLQKLHNAYPQLNLLWLLFGKGEMVEIVNSSTPNSAQTASDTVNSVKESADDVVNDQTIAYMVTPIEEHSTKFTPELSSTANHNNAHPTIAQDGTPGKRIKQIIVYYTDRSFQTFYPEGS